MRLSLTEQKYNFFFFFLLADLSPCKSYSDWCSLQTAPKETISTFLVYELDSIILNRIVASDKGPARFLWVHFCILIFHFFDRSHCSYRETAILCVHVLAICQQRKTELTFMIRFLLLWLFRACSNDWCEVVKKNQSGK